MLSETDPQKQAAAALIDACVGQLPEASIAALRSTLNDGNLDEAFTIDIALCELAQVSGRVPSAVRTLLRAEYGLNEFPICTHHAVLGIDPSELWVCTSFDDAFRRARLVDLRSGLHERTICTDGWDAGAAYFVDTTTSTGALPPELHWVIRVDKLTGRGSIGSLARYESEIRAARAVTTS